MAETAKRIALLVDGDNISADHAGFLIERAEALGRLTICRAYGNTATLPKWSAVPGFSFVHSASGANATDILMIVAAMDIALCARADGIAIASSDTDFVPLLLYLRERSFPVCVIGMAELSAALRKAAHGFVEIPKPETVVPAPAKAITSGQPVTDAQLCAYLRKLVKAEPACGLPISAINGPVSRELKVKISQLPEKNWMAYLKARPEVFVCDPRGKNARVRLKKPS